MYTSVCLCAIVCQHVAQHLLLQRIKSMCVRNFKRHYNTHSKFKVSVPSTCSAHTFTLTSSDHATQVKHLRSYCRLIQNKKNGYMFQIMDTSVSSCLTNTLHYSHTHIYTLLCFLNVCVFISICYQYCGLWISSGIRGSY